MWDEQFFVHTNGDVAAEILTTLPVDIKQRINVVAVFANYQQAVRYYKENSHCFNSLAVFNLGVKGCGKNAIVGYETTLNRHKDLIVEIDDYLQRLHSHFGIIPSTWMELQTSGGSGTGARLTLDGSIKDLVASVHPRVHLIDLISVSRGDDSKPVGNSVLVTLKALSDHRKVSKIFTYYDKRHDQRISTQANISSTIMVLVLLENRAGINQKDLSDYLPPTKSGVVSVNFEYARVDDIKVLTKDDVFRLIERTVILDEGKMQRLRLTFPPSLAKGIYVSVISPIPFEIIDIDSEDLVRARESLNVILKATGNLTNEVDDEAFYLPIRFRRGSMPLIVNTILGASSDAVEYFLLNLRQVALAKARAYLYECLDTGIIENDLLQNFLDGNIERVLAEVVV